MSQYISAAVIHGYLAGCNPLSREVERSQGIMCHRFISSVRLQEGPRMAVRYGNRQTGIKGCAAVQVSQSQT
jgi:hypothetical protein